MQDYVIKNSFTVLKGRHPSQTVINLMSLIKLSIGLLEDKFRFLIFTKGSLVWPDAYNLEDLRFRQARGLSLGGTEAGKTFCDWAQNRLFV